MFNHKDQKHTALMRIITKKSVKIKIICSNNLLRFAIRVNDIKAVKKLVRKGADVNHSGRNRLTPLHMAAQHGHHKIVKFLITNGAFVDATMNEGREQGFTPLHLAVQRNNLECVKILLQNGASVSPKIEDISHPIHLAVFKNFLEIAELLLEKGADVNLRFSNKFFEEHKPKMLRSLWQDQNLPLVHYAIIRNFEKMLFIFHLYDADFNSRTSSGKTALMQAVEHINVNMTYVFIKLKNADVNARDNFGQPVIHFIVLNSKRKLSMYSMEDCELKQEKRTVMKFLIDHGADVNARFPEGNERGAVIHYMIKFGFSWGVRILLHRSFDLNFQEIDLTSLYSAQVFTENLTPDVENDNYFINQLRERFRIIVHLIRVMAMSLQAIGLPVDKNLILTEPIDESTSMELFEDDLNYYRNFMTKQMNYMKENTIGDSNVTFWDFITCDTNQSVKLMSHKALRDFDSLQEEINTNMTYFYAIIGKRLRDAKNRRLFLEESTELISNLLINRVPFDCCRNIVSFIKNEEFIFS